MSAGPHFTPEQLAAWSGGRWTRLPAGPLTGFHFDSRQVGEGRVFVAIRTPQRDGHDFLDAAAQAGAAAALVAGERAAVALPQLVVADPLAAWQAIAREHRRSFRGPVVGISGSAGKTSTKDLLALLLGGASCGVVATEGNFNNHLGVPLTLTRIDPARHRWAVIEAGIGGPGEMPPLADMIRPDLAIITLVAPAHTEALGGLAGVAREKALLPAATRAGGLAVFPRSVLAHAAFRELAVNRLVVERTAEEELGSAPVGVARFAVAQGWDRTVVRLAGAGCSPVDFCLRRVSEGMAQNAALALCAARRLGVADEVLQQRVREWRPAAMRGEVRERDGRLLYLDCYNANPASMVDALETFAALAPAAAPRLYVLGCMEELGEGSAGYHRELGRALRLGAGDRAMIIGSQAAAVAEGLRDGGHAEPQFEVIATLAKAAAAVAEWRGAVFVKGSRRYALEGVVAGREEVPAHA